MKDDDKPIRNPFVVLREEFDDWAVLFNPDACLGFGGFGLNPTGVYLWKLLDGEHSVDELVEKLHHGAEDVPEDTREHTRVFVDALVAERLATYRDTGSYREESSHALLAPLNEVKRFTYDPPKLVNLSGGQAALGACSNHGSHGGSCTGGTGATVWCCSGTCGTTPSCCSGTCDIPPCGSGAATGCICPCNYGVSANSCSNGPWAVSSCGTGTSKGNC